MGYISVQGYKFDEQNLPKRFEEVLKRLRKKTRPGGIGLKEQGWLKDRGIV
jgi:hypothetical protein